MNAPLRDFHLSSLGVFASILIVLSPAIAHSQELQDCNVPSPLPPGSVSKSLAYCAIRHAQFLYVHRCTDENACTVQNSTTVVSAYREASRIFDLYLASRDMATVSKQQQANDAFWRGFLQERSYDYVNAVGNYRLCERLAENSSPQDSDDLSSCKSGLNRINSVTSSHRIGTTRGGGIANSFGGGAMHGSGVAAGSVAAHK
jgi:hypothetical protein